MTPTAVMGGGAGPLLGGAGPGPGLPVPSVEPTGVLRAEKGGRAVRARLPPLLRGPSPGLALRLGASA